MTREKVSATTVCSLAVVDPHFHSNPTAVLGGRWNAAAIGAVLLLAGTLRFPGVTSVGIRFDDEAAYAADARLWYRCARFLTDGEAIRAILTSNQAAIEQRKAAYRIDFSSRYPKPSQGYTFLGTGAMFLVGDTPGALPLVNAVLSTLSVLLLYAISVLLFGRRVALCSAALLAVSPYHLLYARSALANASAGFFILLGTLFWLLGYSQRWPRWKAYGLCGLALGYALVCHFSSVFAPVVLLLVELAALVCSARQDEPLLTRCRLMVRRWLWVAAAMMLPALALEGVFRAARYGAVLAGGELPLATFLEASWYWSKVVFFDPGGVGVTGVSMSLGATIAFLGYFVHWHGIAAVLLAALGMVICTGRTGPGRLPAIMIISTIAFFSLQSHVAARLFASLIPFVCVCAALATVWCAAVVCRQSQRRASWLALFVTALVAIPSLSRSIRLREKHGDIEAACAFIAQRGGPVVVPTGVKYRLYLEPAGIRMIPADYFHSLDSPEATLTHLRETGARWLITDPQYFCYQPGSEMFQWWDVLRKHLKETSTPTAEFPHMTDYRWEFLSEGGGLHRVPEMHRLAVGPIRIYDLQQPLAITTNSNRSAVCNGGGAARMLK